MHLQAAERMMPSIDVALFVSKARQRPTNAGGHEVNAIARVAFDKHLVVARRCIVAALEGQGAFWAALGDAVPDMTRLVRASVAMNAAVGGAHEAFEQLLRIKAKVGGALWGLITKKLSLVAVDAGGDVSVSVTKPPSTRCRGCCASQSLRATRVYARHTSPPCHARRSLSRPCACSPTSSASCCATTRRPRRSTRRRTA